MTRAIKNKMARAESYKEWKDAAMAYDNHHGLESWKHYERSSRYDYAAIRRRLDKLRIFRRANDNHGLLYTLHEGIHGNIGGMGRSALYEKTKFGTKQLIVDYVNEVSSALTHLSKPRLKGVTTKEAMDFFERASLCFGQSALLMSGSGTYLFFHVGVLKALWEQDLIPEVISGSSGGALVAAIVGTRKSTDLAEVFEPEFVSVESEIRSVLSRVLSPKLVEVGIDQLIEVVEKLIPDLTFEEAYDVSGIHINISVAPAETHQKSRLLNATTTPNVMVREAVMASCSVPGLFPPVTLAAKDVKGERVPYLPSRRWVDGSVSDDLPMKRLSRLYHVNHYIVSQTNPIVVPFLNVEKQGDGVLATLSQTGIRTIKDWGLAAGHILQKPLSNSSYFSKLINGYISVVSQSYTGDITILPTSRFLNPATALANRTDKEIFELISEGERSTWPKIEQIRNQTKIGRVLSRIVKELDERVLRASNRAEAKRKLKVVNQD